MTLLMAGAAYASGGEAGGEHHYDWMNLAFRVANFFIVGAIIWFAAGKKIVAFFRNRRASIEGELAELDTRKKEAAAKLKEVESSIANLEAERAKILEDYRSQGEALKAAILEKAEKSAAQVREQAKRTAENESRLAVERIREEMADMVAEAAEKLLRERLGKEEHEQLIDKYLEKVVLN